MLFQLLISSVLSFTTIYECDFSEEQMKGWSFRNNIEKEFLIVDSRKAIKLTYTDLSNSYAAATYTLSNLRQYIGQDLIFTVYIKAENVSQPQHSWNGIKFMFTYTVNGITQYPQNSPSRAGSFDFQKAQFHVSITENVSDISTVNFGLQESTGVVYFSEFSIQVGQFMPKPDVPSGFVCEYTNVVKRRPQMRGVMSPSKYVENDLSDLRSWNASLIRWQINNGDNEKDFLGWLDRKIDELELALKENEEKKLGINFVVDFHSCPGGRNFGGECVIGFEEDKAQIYFESWRRIANRVKGRNGVWAYDLFNEPVQKMMMNEGRDYLSIQIEAAKIIRNIDPITPIIIESAEYDGINAFKYLPPIDMKDIIYEVHMYLPLAFTHQNVNNEWSEDALRSYPGLIDGKMYNRDVLEELMMPTIEFQKNYSARIFLGEFSAVRWADGADIYIEDVINIAEKYKWDWTYHAYREWPGWSVEHVEDHTKVSIANYTTKRKAVLLKYFERNSFNDIDIDDDDDIDDIDDDDDDDATTNKKKLTGGQIAGIVIGVLLAAAAIIVVVVIVIIKKKNNDLEFSLLHDY